MSKRKRVSKPAGESTDDASVKEDMVHVTPDVLAGSPDVFAGKKTDEPVRPQPETDTEPDSESETEDDSESEAESEADSEADPESDPEPDSEPAATVPEPSVFEATAEAPPEPAEARATPSPEPEVERTGSTPPPQPPHLAAPPFMNATPYPSGGRRIGSSAALGMVLIVLGLFALVVVVAGVDLTQYGWPLFVIIPGLTLLVAGFVSFGSGASIPGGVVTMLGLVLAYQNGTGDWPSWAYAWALIIPFGVGLGIYLQALRDRDQHALGSGRTLMLIGLMIFAIGFVLFESILGISGRDYFGVVGKAALPALLIVIGVILLVRSVQRARSA